MLNIKKNKIADFLVITLFSVIIFAGLKYGCISRGVNGVSPFYSIWGYVLQDYLVWMILSLPIFLIGGKILVLNLLIFISFAINIIFISKTGYPLSSSLLSQVGDLMTLQTSIASPSVYRNLYILIAASGLFLAALILVNLIDLTKWLRLIVFKFSILTVVILLSFFKPMHSQVPRFASNLLVAILNPPISFSEILTKDSLKGFTAAKWEKLSPSKSNAVKKNVIIIVVETLTYNMPEETMPFLKSLEKKAENYQNHFTSWPFSSKSLFSLMCGQPPLPDSLIEMRLGMKFSCQNWMGYLINSEGYRSFLSYTGDLRYDNMQGFFEQIGIKDLFDRRNIENLKSYKSSKLSIDDQSMVDQFVKWKSKEEGPYVAMFVTMNSHFPFWTPHEEFEYSNDPYLNSMRYQDEIIKNIYNELEKTGELKNSLFIVTGDHGRREASSENSLLPKSMYHVPLLIINGEEKSDIGWPTNHYQIGSTILEKSVGVEFGIKDFNLKSKQPVFSFFISDEMIFTILSESKNTVFQGGEQIFSEVGSWPSSSSKSCLRKNCPEEFKKYHEYLSNLREIYEEK